MCDTGLYHVKLYARYCKRNLPVAHNFDLSGTSGFADDTALKTDSLAAVLALRCQVQVVGGFLEWSVQLVQFGKLRGIKSTGLTE